MKNLMNLRSCLHRNTRPGVASAAHSWRCITNQGKGVEFVAQFVLQLELNSRVSSRVRSAFSK